MEVITRDNIYTESWNNVFSVLNNLTNPHGSGKWIYSTFPDIKINKSSFPILILNPADVRIGSVAIPDMGELYEAVISFDIDLYTTSAQQLDEIGDEIRKVILAFRDEFQKYNMYFIDFSESSHSVMRVDNRLKIHSRTLGISFRVMLE